MRTVSFLSVLSLAVLPGLSQEVSDALPDGSNGILLGDDVSGKDRYPYMTVLYESDGNWVCGGTLIASTWVLTAAHCVDDGIDVTSVEVGRYNMERNNGHYESINVQSIIMHPDYDPDTFAWDVALLELESRSTKAVVQLDDGSEDLVGIPFFGTQLTAVGFGSLFGIILAFLPSTLQEAPQTYYTNGLCNMMVLSINAFASNQLCTLSFGGTCVGDSGGPLLKKGRDASSDVQVGIVSFGYFLCALPFPDGYTRVSSAYDWIQENIS